MVTEQPLNWNGFMGLNIYEVETLQKVLNDLLDAWRERMDDGEKVNRHDYDTAYAFSKTIKKILEDTPEDDTAIGFVIKLYRPEILVASNLLKIHVERHKKLKEDDKLDGLDEETKQLYSDVEALYSKISKADPYSDV